MKNKKIIYLLPLALMLTACNTNSYASEYSLESEKFISENSASKVSTTSEVSESPADEIANNRKNLDYADLDLSNPSITKSGIYRISGELDRSITVETSKEDNPVDAIQYII